MSEMGFAWQAKDTDGLMSPVTRLIQPMKSMEVCGQEGLPISCAAGPPGSVLKIQFPGPLLQSLGLPFIGPGSRGNRCNPKLHS